MVLRVKSIVLRVKTGVLRVKHCINDPFGHKLQITLINVTPFYGKTNDFTRKTDGFTRKWFGQLYLKSSSYLLLIIIYNI